jgi:hypothetical protein
MRVQARKQGGGAQRWTQDRQRPKGDVRIERLEEVRHNPPPAHAEDAEFEVIPDKPDDR